MLNRLEGVRKTESPVINRSLMTTTRHNTRSVETRPNALRNRLAMVWAMRLDGSDCKAEDFFLGCFVSL